MITIQHGEIGARAVSGEFVNGQLIITRDDGSTFPLPGVVIIRGTLVDNGDGTNNIIFPED